MSTGTVGIVDRGPKAISRTTVVDVPAYAIFSRLIDPRRHHELDGSGTVQRDVSGPERLREGDRFTVVMKMFGIPYRITSTVTRLSENQEIEWRHPAGHTWRWELEPLPGERTRVTETWDYSTARAAAIYRLIGLPKSNTTGIEATLRNLPANVTDR